MQKPFITISDAGATITNQRPSAPIDGKHDYTRRPVKVAIHRDMTIEIHGTNFSASTKLTADDALSIVTMLSYALREQLARTPTEFVQVPA